MDTKKIEHGADLYQISEILGIEKEKILDFSSNINPYGASQKAKEAVIKNIDSVSIYPDPQYRELKSVISDYCGVREENIILGSGATELISALIKSVEPGRALLLSPAYSEYERELKKIGCHIDEILYKEEMNFQIDMEDLLGRIEVGGYDLIIICNPNNPTGTSLTREELERILKVFPGVLMVDETYIEFTDLEKYSGAPLVENYSNLFIIRGTSKFFATPGIRLGYGLLSQGELYQKIGLSSNLWNINIFATLMGEVMFSDREYIERCRRDILLQREYLHQALASLGDIKVYNSTSNFILCQILRADLTAEKLREILLKEGIVIRDAGKFSGLNEKFFRVCLLKSEDNRKLVGKLKEIFEKN